MADQKIVFGTGYLLADEDGQLYVNAEVEAAAGGATEAKQDNQITLAGSVTETAPATDTASSGLNGRLQRIAQRLTSLIALIPASLGAKTASASLAVTVATDDVLVGRLGEVQASPTSNTVLDRLKAIKTSLDAAVPAGEAHVGQIGGAISSVSKEFTRPNDTTPYTIGDVVSDSTGATTVQSIASIVRVSGGSGYIVGARLLTDKKSITPRIRVHLFNTTGATLSVDNALYQSKYADISKRNSSFDLPAMQTGTDTTNSDNSGASDMGIRIPFKATDSNIYFVLETLDTFTPAALEKFTLVLYFDQN